MPKIIPGNRLYIYQLLSREIGVGRQTLLPRVEEVVLADGFDPEDLGCASMRELCEQLPEFIKLTVFKKGYVYATVIANEEYDRALDRLAAAAEKKPAAGGKPWKRAKGAKALKPAKPRHTERATPADEGADKRDPIDQGPAEPKTVEVEAEAKADAPVEKGAEPETETAPSPQAAPAPTPAQQSEATPSPEVAPVPAPAQGPEPAPEPEAEIAPTPALEPEAAPRPEEVPGTAASPEPAREGEEAPAPVPEPAHVPPITFTITYVPEPQPGAGADSSPEPAPILQDEPTPGPSPASASEPSAGASPAPSAAVAARAQSDLPRDFHTDVRCSSEQLSILYQVLPADVDPMATLEEDFRVARSAGTIEGTRSNVTFSLRYLQADGVTPVRVTLRRSARAVAGKRWALTEVDAGATDEVGLEGLDVAERGAWAAFLRPGDAADPERDFAQTVSLGSRDEALERLAGLARPESWGEGNRILGDYLAMTFARVRAEGGPTVSADGSAAHFDTGLVTAQGDPIRADLVAAAGDIPWQLAGFTAGEPAHPVSYVESLSQMTIDPSLPAPAFSAAEEVRRNPRVATPAYDPIHNEVLLLVPDNGRALALAPGDSGYEEVAALELADAYACARVVSSEQPAWLRG